MKWFSIEDVLYLHSRIIADTGGSDGIRDFGLFESALYTPMQTFDGKDLYPTIIDKATRLAFSLVENHPFIDENKRIGALSLTIVLRLNNIIFNIENDELIGLF